MSASAIRRAAIINYRKRNIRTMHKSYGLTVIIVECGRMPNVMVALPNIGGALCSTPQSWADAHYLTAGH